MASYQRYQPCLVPTFLGADTVEVSSREAASEGTVEASPSPLISDHLVLNMLYLPLCRWVSEFSTKGYKIIVVFVHPKTEKHRGSDMK